MRMRQPAAGLRERPSGRAGHVVSLRRRGEPALPGRDATSSARFSATCAPPCGLSREAIARRLATTPGTIEDFENGAVVRPAALAGDDPHRARLLRAAAPRSRADPVAHPAASCRQSGQPTRRRRRGRRHSRHPVRRPRCLRSVRNEEAASRAAPRGAAAHAHGCSPSARPSPWLPLPSTSRTCGSGADLSRHRHASRARSRCCVRAGHGQLPAALGAAPRGLRWIDVGDPQLRKVDKLQTSAR